jgi:hypothetical protein
LLANTPLIEDIDALACADDALKIKVIEEAQDILKQGGGSIGTQPAVETKVVQKY